MLKSKHIDITCPELGDFVQSEKMFFWIHLSVRTHARVETGGCVAKTIKFPVIISVSLPLRHSLLELYHIVTLTAAALVRKKRENVPGFLLQRCLQLELDTLYDMCQKSINLLISNSVMVGSVTLQLFCHLCSHRALLLLYLRPSVSYSL